MRAPKDTVVSVRSWALTGPMSQPFAIATGRHDEILNALVRVRLADGTEGWGECGPAPHITGEDQRGTLKALQGLAPLAEGLPASLGQALSRTFEEAYPDNPCARAGLEMALLDATLRRLGVPLWRWLGGGPAKVRTDVTIPLVPLGKAPLEAARLQRDGIRVIKVKIGRDADEDIGRVLSIAKAAPLCRLILDANQGYGAATALRVWRSLEKRGLPLILFEQPVKRADWDGLASLTRAGLPTCADESVSTRDDARRMAKKKAVRVVNVKLMKSGLWQALEIGAISRRAGLELMIGGMVESSLAMGCAAHAAAAWKIPFVDLDTPLFFAEEPMRGLRLGRDGVYDLTRVKAGIGAVPKRAPR